MELILARFGLLETASPSSKEPDEGVREAICAVVYSAQRTEIRELHAIREALMQRFGRDWALSVMEGASGVSNRITNKLSTKTPDNDWVDMYLYEIAKAYQVDWKPEGLAELETTISDKDGESSTAAQEERLQEAALSTPHTSQPAGPSDDNDGPSTALPTAPSSIPSLKDVRSSTSHVPIVHSPPTGPSASDTSLGSTTTLPSIPPTDPDEASHTVIIRSNLGTTAPQRSAAVSKSQDSKFDVSRVRRQGIWILTEASNPGPDKAIRGTQAAMTLFFPHVHRLYLQSVSTNATYVRPLSSIVEVPPPADKQQLRVGT